MEEQTILDKILNPMFSVRLPSLEEDIPCRDLPFTTLAYILGRLAEQARHEVLAERSRLVEAITQLTQASVDDDQRDLNVDLRNSIQVIWPLISRIIMESEAITCTVMCSVIIGAEDKHIKSMSVVDLICVIDAVLERIDTDLLAEKLKSIFFHAATAWNKAAQPQEAGPNSEENSQPSPQEASPVSVE